MLTCVRRCAPRALIAAIQKGYHLSSAGAAKGNRDIFTGQNTYGNCKRVYSALEAWKKPFMAHAFELMVELEDDEAAIMAKLVEVVDRSIHCRQVQIKSFNVVVGVERSERLIVIAREVELKEKLLALPWDRCRMPTAWCR